MIILNIYYFSDFQKKTMKPNPDAAEIDKILLEAQREELITPVGNGDYETERLMKKAYDLELLEETSKAVYRLSKLGHEVLDSYGGYINYLRDKEAEARKDKDIKELTLKQLKGNIFHLKYWWVILLLSALLGFISGNFKLIQNLLSY